MFVLKTIAEPETRPIEVDLGDNGKLSIVVRGLSLSEELAAELSPSPLAARVHAAVTDWSGVSDADGKPVAFSREVFLAACRQDRRILIQVISAVAEMYVGREASKKS